MRALHLAIFLLTSIPLWSQELTVTDRFGAVLTDPRQPVSFYTMFENGKEPATDKFIHNSILIICWVPAPDGTFGKYQIGGLEGYHTKDQVTRFLARFYEMDHPKETKMDRPNIILAGNNWGAGLELMDTLRDLSAKKSLMVYYVGGWAFSKATLISEQELRKNAILRSYKEANPQ